MHKADGGKAVTFALEAFDSYTSKRIATATGTSETSNDIVPVILDTTVRKYIDAFDSQMDRYFAGLVQNGREIVLTVRCWDSWENDLETEYDGEELTEDIYAEDISYAGLASAPVELGDGEYFVIGDNAAASDDSRSPDAGPVSEDEIYGKVWFVASFGDHFGFI